MSATTEEVLAYFDSLAQGIAEKRGDTTLWLLTLPGLTRQIFEESCVAVGLAGSGAWPKGADVSGAAWHRLKDECHRRCGTSVQREEEQGRKAFMESSVYLNWRENLETYQRRENNAFQTRRNP